MDSDTLQGASATAVNIAQFRLHCRARSSPGGANNLLVRHVTDEMDCLQRRSMETPNVVPSSSPNLGTEENS